MSSAPAQTATIERIVERTPDTRSFFLRLAGGRPIPFVPGQFLSFLLPAGGTTLTRAYTIASLPDETALVEICLNRVPGGPGSAYLFNRREGDELRFTGPWGRFVLDETSDAEHVFIADRVGVVPFRPMLARLLTGRPESPVRLVYGAARESELLFLDEWRAWERRCAGFSFHPLTPGAGQDAYSIEATVVPYVEQRFVHADANRDRRFYLCGIGRPTLRLRDILRGTGYARSAVKYEKW